MNVSTLLNTFPLFSWRIRIMDDLLQPEVDASSCVCCCCCMCFGIADCLLPTAPDVGGGSGFLKNSDASTHSSAGAAAAETSANSGLAAVARDFELEADGVLRRGGVEGGDGRFVFSSFRMRSLTDEFLLLRLALAAVARVRFS
jgi:hypothetical protein